METKKSLKKFFVMMVLWLVAIMVIFAGSALYDKSKSLEYDDRAMPYIMQIVPKISQWDPEKTRALIAPEVSAAISEEQLAQAMDLFSRLGTLQSMDEPEFENLHLEQQTDMGKQTVVEYNIEAKYENGDAVINLKLIDRGDSFQVYQFNVSSELLANK